MSITWQALYNEAKNRLNPRTISPFIDAGGVAAALLTKGATSTQVCVLIHLAH